MADSNKGNQQRRDSARRRGRRSGSARSRVMQSEGRSSGARKKKRFNTPLHCRQPLPPGPPRASYVCPMCSERISNLVEALEYVEGEGPSHFGCVMRKLEKIHLVDREHRRIVYRGQGAFMIVENVRSRKRGQESLEKNSPVHSNLAIHSTIPYETRDRQPWRKCLTNRLMERVLEV